LTALAYGHTNAAVLDGDFSAWRRDYETSDEPPTVEPTTYEIDSLADDAPSSTAQLSKPLSRAARRH